jgi:hypothetical protein
MVENFLTFRLTFLPTWRETHRAEKNSLLRHLKFFPREFWGNSRYAAFVQPLLHKKLFDNRKTTAVLVMQWIVCCFDRCYS